MTREINTEIFCIVRSIMSYTEYNGVNKEEYTSVERTGRQYRKQL